jgi:hypothetical protein
MCNVDYKQRIVCMNIANYCSVYAPKRLSTLFVGTFLMLS